MFTVFHYNAFCFWKVKSDVSSFIPDFRNLSLFYFLHPTLVIDLFKQLIFGFTGSLCCSSIPNCIYFYFIMSFLLQALGLDRSSSPSFFRWKVTLLIWYLHHFNINVHSSNLSLSTAFTVTHKFEYVVFLCSLISKNFLSSLGTSSSTHWLFTQWNYLYNPWDSLGLNTGVGSLSFLQAIFLTQGSNPGLPHCRQILYQLSHKRSPRILEWVAYPFSSGSSQPRNRTRVSCIACRFFTNWALREAHISIWWNTIWP